MCSRTFSLLWFPMTNWNWYGFGTFEARKRAARTGRNPQTGKEIKIAAKTVPAFSAGKKFKDLVNKK